MKILLVPSSEAAELSPWLALGRRLRALGWGVALAAAPEAAALIEAARLEAVETDPHAPLRARAEALFGAAQDAGLLLADAAQALLAASVAEARHVPLITVDFTPALPLALLPRWRALLPDLDRWGEWLAQRPDLNRFRRAHALARLGHRWRQPAAALRLAAYSPRLAAPPAGVMSAGFWQDDPAPEWRAPAELIAFLEGGAPPVCLLLDAALHDARAALLEGAARYHGRMLFVGGDAAPSELPPDALWLATAPLEWLLPRCAALIHGGAYSACAAAFHAGLPQWILALEGKAGIYGRLIAARGMGLAPVAAARLDAEAVERGLRTLRADPGYRHKALQLRKEIHSERGIEAALRWIQSILIQQRAAAPLRPE